jgi:hypothetical protein
MYNKFTGKILRQNHTEQQTHQNNEGQKCKQVMLREGISRRGRVNEESKEE